MLDTTIQGYPASALFDEEAGTISPLVYSDQGIYEQELDRIFGRSWLFIAHEKHIPKTGDFFSTYMAEDPVVAVRQKDGSVAVLLNQCRHRGMKICRADQGNAKAFTCSYHGWAYGIDGALVNVPSEEHYGPCFNKEEWPARRVPRVESYKGLIFANWDEHAQSLKESLGEAALYLDALLDRSPTGTEPIGGIYKWVIPCNWKLAAEQFASDMHHGVMSHVSVQVATTPEYAGKELPLPGRQLLSDQGHGTGFFLAPGLHEDWIVSQAGQREPGYDSAALAQRHAAHNAGVSAVTAQHMTVFPTFSFFGGVHSCRVWHPRGPGEIEVWAFCLVDSDASPAEKEQLRQATLRTFSPAGTWEQDDGENWVEIQRVLRGHQARRTTMSIQMGKDMNPAEDPVFPGTVEGCYSEEAARRLYGHWLKLMCMPTQHDTCAKEAGHGC
ncbi:aromatic ring-hydroxylating oxygenase subunit alpha [Burkholderia ambifaria]|uniref:aromatic ring-hydroxylating oxygenase subunit alpha n=1 Tax=Burkholderia ambifaria TaxID=152480 RepID=UPI000CFF2ECC|nr:aromatic ring-hydroxylating dioxygenase subunit alpha [Burkholderia ambifaria]PRD95901.1 benzene 1,2-dioxygenase [Burkholderia ambifaria]